MNSIRLWFAAAVVAGLLVGVGACHRVGSQPLERSDKVAQAEESDVPQNYGEPAEAYASGQRFDAYIGEIFAQEQKALSSRPAEADAPSF